jgi:hypothetical protein
MILYVPEISLIRVLPTFEWKLMYFKLSSYEQEQKLVLAALL